MREVVEKERKYIKYKEKDNEKDRKDTQKEKERRGKKSREDTPTEKNRSRRKRKKEEKKG